VNRRGFALGVGAVLALRGAAAWAQPATVQRIAYLSGASRSDTEASFGAFVDGLRELGYVEGKNLAVDARWSDYSAERATRLAGEIAARRPALIVTQGGGLRPASRLLPSIPLVFLQSGDPVEAGVADSYARPGRNATGVSLLAVDMLAKRIEILQQVLPKLRRVALLANPEHPGEQRELAATRAAAEQLRTEVSYHQARNPGELDVALAAVAAARPDAAVLFSDALMLGQRQTLAAFFLKHRIPSGTGWASFAESGHLLSYGPNVLAAWRRVAYFVDRVLKGARPGDIPIELPTTIETVINRRTAAAMGLTVPPALLARADRIIE
jgi:putative tryptophan/tyrosine transport system substrate-binding protein